MWRDFIDRLSTDIKFHSPAKLNETAEVELALEISLPSGLRDLLQESNGVEGSYGLGLIWETERIKRDNLSFRRSSDFKDLYMPFDHLLFFADAGNGDQFAFAILNKEIRTPDIFVWNHENDSREWIAPSLEKYLEWWLSGKLKI
jgi:SMI1-KNR4 cell-wall